MIHTKYAFFLGPLAFTVFNWTEERPDGRENGCRVQLQRLHCSAAGSPQATPTYRLEEALWRGDFFSLEDGAPGNTARAHHHISFSGLQPGPRVFDEELRSDPLGWFERRLADLPGLLAEVGAADLLADLDLDEVARIRPALVAAVRDCMRAPSTVSGTRRAPPSGDSSAR